MLVVGAVMSWPRRATLAITLALSAPSCTSTPEGTIELVTGGESDVFTRAPAPRTITVDAFAADGKKSSVFSGPISASLDLGTLDRTLLRRLEVRAADEAGVVRVRGGSLFFQYGALDGGAVLQIFVQRAGETARLPQPFPDGRRDPLVDVVRGRVVVVAGGGGRETQLYDLLRLRPVSSPPVLARVPRSLAVFDLHVVASDDAGASDFDLALGASSDVVTPALGTFGEVAGGQTVYASNGAAFVVGATRTSGAPTARVLRIDAAGKLAFVSLTTPRLGAAAAWVEGRGVVVIGGAAGPTAAAAEVLTVDGALATPTPLQPDGLGTRAAVALDGSRVLVAPDPRVIDLGCSQACTPERWPALPAKLVTARAYTTPDLVGGAIVVGNDEAGATRVFVVKKDAAEERPLKVARSGAGSVGMPTGGVGIVAGGSGVIESFVP